MKTVRLTMGQALVRWLTAQKTLIDGEERQLFPGVFAIFGHGNVTCVGEALETVQDVMPTWRGQNEQSMALAAIGYTKAMKRRQIMVSLSSIGPGATNMVTAAGVAHSNRLPILLLSGDIYASRRPDPVLQQVEHFNDPTVSVNDCFKAVTRYWDRITRPEQIIQSLPQALATMLDPADCGPAFIGLCQDIQAEGIRLSRGVLRAEGAPIPRPRPDVEQLVAAADLMKARSGR
ncbi:MAG: thiamine pyrophosphate-binding protein [Alphaproteobacteria bacterium]